MAAKTSVRVAVTNNAAKDDSFSGGSLGWLAEDGSLSGNLNVLGNDPGSATLYGVSGDLPSGTGQLAAQPNSTFTVTYEGNTYTGYLTVNADGTVGLDLSSIAGSLDSLAEGETFDFSFYYTAKMANGALSTAKVSVSLTGANDAPVATAETVFVNEGDAVVLGQVDASDVDHGAVLTYDLLSTATAGFVFNADGTYSFDAANAVYEHLAEGVVEEQILTYSVTDEHGAISQADITIAITGTNDAASISGDSVGTVSEDDVVSVSGVLAVTDVDDGEAHTEAYSINGGFGAFTVDADGNWGYTLDHALADSLAFGDVETEIFSVTSKDGTAQQDVTITIHGTNDAASIAVDGSAAQDTSVAEAGNAGAGDPNASGKLLVSDVDNGEAGFQTPASLHGTYGDFTFDAGTGAWTYALRNGDANVEALASGQNVTDSLLVTSLDGTASQSIVVNIAGADDVVNVIGTRVLQFTGINGTIDNYAGFNFTSSGSTYSSTADWYGTGSEAYNGWNGKTSDMVRVDGADFSVDHLDIRDWSGARQVDFVGFNNGVEIYRTHVTLSSAYQTVDLDFANIDDLRVIVTHGDYSGNGVNNTGWWLMDNLWVA